MKHQVPAMLRQGGGSIVNTASIAGLVGLPTSSAYVASKHAVIGITKTAALEYALDRIRVNAVCPGYIRTPMTDASVERRGEELMSKIPVRRIGEPDDIAEAVVWMSSDRAGYITGSAYAVDGGYSAM
jgi:NAD(P)-dependent dehydrogenase (short-subunit alcohol dehydrogenase family)